MRFVREEIFTLELCLLFPIASVSLIMPRRCWNSPQTAGWIWITPRFEVAVLGGINLWDWKLSMSTQNVIMRHFGSMCHFLCDQQLCVTLTHAHSCKGKKGNKENWKEGFSRHTKKLLVAYNYLNKTSFLNAEWPSSITVSRTTPEIWRYSHHLVDYFNRIPPSLSLGIHRGLSGGRLAGNPSCLVRCRVSGTQHLSKAPHKSPPSAAESGRYHCTLQLHNHKYIHLVRNTRDFAVGQIMTLPILWNCMTKGE